MQTAEASIEDRDLSLEQKRHTNIYFSLPRYYASLNAVPDIEPGQLKAETLERIDTLFSRISDKKNNPLRSMLKKKVVSCQVLILG